MKRKVFNDFREILDCEYAKRKKRNPKYSMRAFARDLNLASSSLTEIMNGKSSISEKRAEKISIKLGLIENQKKFFLTLAKNDYLLNNEKKTKKKNKKIILNKTEYTDLHIDYCKVIADWYHYAILELFQLSDFENTSAYISKKLNLPESIVNEAIDRLLKIGLLSKDNDGSLKLVNDFTAGSDGIPSKTIRDHHLQLLQKAILAINNQNVHERDISSITMAFDSEKLSDAKIKIKKFRRSFNTEMSLSENKNEVYCLSVQFFKLTEKNQGEKNE